MPRLQCTYAEAHSAAAKKVGQGKRTKEWQYEFYLDGRWQFKVTIPDSHGQDKSEIPIGTLKNIQTQLKLTRDEFTRWRDCPLDRERYEELVRERLGIPSESKD